MDFKSIVKYYGAAVIATSPDIVVRQSNIGPILIKAARYL